MKKISDNTIVIIDDYDARINKFVGKIEMTYEEYRREWGPGVSENASIIELKTEQVCIRCGKTMWFHGNPYEEKFGESICYYCEHFERWGEPL